MNEQEITRKIAERICERFFWRGQRFKEGNFVALLAGKVIAVADNPDDAIAALRAIEPDVDRGMVVEVRVRWSM
jgi:hypothetical protein